MKNREQLIESLNSMRKEFAEALEKGNKKMQDYMANEILRLELVLKEEHVYKEIEQIKKDFSTEIELIVEDEEALRQESLIRSFNNKFKEIVSQKAGSVKNPITESQAKTIMAGMRDRVGIEVTQEQIEYIYKLNINQASSVIRLLKGISFYNQRVMVTSSLKKLKDREDYSQILAEVYNNIYRKEWFDMNSELIKMSHELVEPTESQIRTIANLCRYIETHETLKSEFGISVDDFENRPEGKNYYVFNYEGIKEEIRNKFNKQSASNFIQTWNYISNYYEGNKLDSEQIKYIRGLYMQLGEYENTKSTYLSAITKQHYDLIVGNLESQLRLNKIAQNDSNKRYREAMRTTASKTREVRDIRIKEEQKQCKELVEFVRGLYSCVGQEVPDEMNRILPYYIERGEVSYAGVEEVHKKEFRRMVFEQKEIIKNLNPYFNWGGMICDQPPHILSILGLDILM